MTSSVWINQVDELVERLNRLMHDAGVAVPSPLRGDQILDEIDEALVPARLPAEVRRPWELIDADALVNSVRTHPELANPSFCLWSRKNLDEPDQFTVGHPRHFFQVFYSSHDEMSVECDGPGWKGGCLFEWSLSDPADPFVLRFRSVVDWLGVLVEVLDAGAYQKLSQSTLLVDHARHEHLAAARLMSQPPHSEYRATAVITRDRGRWPELWRQRENALTARA